MLFEIGLGDAYGRAFEFNDVEFIKTHNKGMVFAVRPDEDLDLYSRYTDDTQMSIAIAEALLQDSIWDTRSVALRFMEAFERDPHTGYSKRMYKALTESIKFTGKRRVDKFLKMCDTDYVVNSNGTVMRSVPMGVLPTEGQVIRMTQIQSAVTHSSTEASYCAQIIALTAHYLWHRKYAILSVDDYVIYMESQGMVGVLQLCVEAFKSHSGPIPCDAKLTTGAVLFGLWQFNNMTDMLKWSVSLGGDVDSVASVILGLASLKDDVEMNIPVIMRTTLELQNDRYGRKYLKLLDKELEDKFPRKKP